MAISITPRRSSLRAHRLTPDEAALPTDRPLPQLFTRTVPCHSSIHPSLPTPTTTTGLVKKIPRRATTEQISKHSHLGLTADCPIKRMSTGIERSKSTQGLAQLQSACRATSFPPTPTQQATNSNNNSNSNTTTTTCTSRSMASIYQLVSTRVKASVVPTTPRDSFSGGRTTPSLHHAPSFTGSDTTSRSNYSGQSIFSVPSLANSVSSQSTTHSSLASTESAHNHAFTPINPTAPSVSSKPSFRSSSGASINKSIHSLLRRRKQKPVDLSLSPSLNPRTIPPNELIHTTPLAVHRVPQSAIAPSAPMGPNDTQSCQSALPFGSFPPQKAAEVNESVPQTTIFSGSLIVAKDLPLAGTHPRPAAAKQAPRRAGSGSSGEDSEMEDMINNLRTIAQTHKPGGPATIAPATPAHAEDDDDEEDEEEDLEMDEMMQNLRGLAAARTGKESGPELEDDGCSVDYSDSGSESSFEADVLDHDQLAAPFPLPSWPTLDSTSQCPFVPHSLRTPAFRPNECSVSLSLDTHH